MLQFSLLQRAQSVRSQSCETWNLITCNNLIISSCTWLQALKSRVPLIIHPPVWLALSWATSFPHSFPDNRFCSNTLELMSCEALSSVSCVIHNEIVRAWLTYRVFLFLQDKRRLCVFGVTRDEGCLRKSLCVCLSPFFLTCVHVFLVYLCAVPPSQQKEKKVTVKAEEGNSIVLKCNPPQSSMEPVIHWMDEREFIISASISFLFNKSNSWTLCPVFCWSY